MALTPLEKPAIRLKHEAFIAESSLMHIWCSWLPVICADAEVAMNKAAMEIVFFMCSWVVFVVFLIVLHSCIDYVLNERLKLLS